MSRRELSAVLVLLALGAGDARAQAALDPPAVLAAVERWLPSLLKAEQDVRVAEGDLVAARGAFDLTLRADGILDRGAYDSETLRLTAEQPIAASGLNAYGGYRLGRGTYAPYEGRLQTLSDGEVSAGVSLPLLRDRATDSRRTEQRLATLGVDLAGATLQRVRLSAYREALLRYWDVVAAAEQWRIQAALLQLAEQRDRQLADAVALGQVAAIERIDNARAVRQRQAALVGARRLFEQQAIELSLHLRGDTGEPRVVTADAVRLPNLDAPLPPPDESISVATAVQSRPELRALEARRAQLAAVEQLARNTQLPQLNLFSEAARDFGTGADSRAGSAFKGGVSFSLPLRRQRAIGQTIRATAALAGLDQERRVAIDRVRADVQDAISAWRAADEAVAAIRGELTLARELEALERDRFMLGDSTQFMVNLRELATADAALRDVRAVAERHKARVALDAATGALLGGRQP
jgi:cobalt-zinc-cadmium efflux system outer membrane protein